MADRLNKFLALTRGISRRAADELIEQGRVTINGKQATLGARFDPALDTVSLDGTDIVEKPAFRYIAFNKPVGFVCSRRAQGDTPTIYSLLPPEFHTLKPVGRLDRDSSGLILLTNDGDFAYRMTHPKFHKTKIYEVTLDHSLQPLHRQMISDFGVMLPDGKSKFELERVENAAKRVTTHGEASSTTSSLEDSVFPVGARQERQLNQLAPSGSEREDGGEVRGSNTGDTRWRITMHEGRNRQIRRTFAALGYTVVALHRTHFGNYSLGDIKPGTYIDVDMR